MHNADEAGPSLLGNLRQWRRTRKRDFAFTKEGNQNVHTRQHKSFTVCGR